MTRACVTGGAGFLGTNLCLELKKRGYEVVALDNNYADRKSLLEGMGIEVIHGNVEYLSPKSFPFKPKFDVVFHLAVVCLEECMDKPLYGWRVNTEGTLQICKRAKKSGTFMVYVSSCEAYGNCKMNPARSKPYRALGESDLLEPRSLYGVSKAAGEHITRSYFYNKSPLQYLILRPFNTYGPYAREDKYAMVVTKFIQRLRKGLAPKIHGGGQQTREWNYVDDTVRGIIECYENREALSLTPVVNICSGNEKSVSQLYQLIQEATQCFVLPKFTKRRPNDVQQLFGDGTLAELLVGFKPEITLTQGLKRYIEWWNQTHEGNR